MQVRRYEGGKWLVVNITDTKFELAYAKGVARLLKYFNGNNDKARGGSWLAREAAGVAGA